MSFLLRFLPAALLPWVLPGLLSLLVGGGGLGAWAFNLTDWKTAGLLVGAVGLSLVLFWTQSPIARIAIAIVIAATLYLKGRIDENIRGEAELAALKKQHEENVTTIHKTYADASKVEEARQEAANTEARKRADEAKVTFDEERKGLRAELQRLKGEAANDKDAKRPAFSLDAIDRLNRLRHVPRSGGVPGSRVSPKNPKTSLLGDAAMPALLGVAAERAFTGRGGDGLAARFEDPRGLPQQALGSVQVRRSEGRSADWRSSLWSDQAQGG